MLTLRYSKYFLSTVKKLQNPQQGKLANLLEIMKENPFHTKHLTGKLSGLYSFRITQDWRVIFQFLSPQEIQLVNVAHCKDIYR